MTFILYSRFCKEDLPDEKRGSNMSNEINLDDQFKFF